MTLALVYKVHPNVNLYGAGTAIRTNDTELGFQAGVIGLFFLITA